MRNIIFPVPNYLPFLILNAKQCSSKPPFFSIILSISCISNIILLPSLIKIRQFTKRLKVSNSIVSLEMPEGCGPALMANATLNGSLQIVSTGHCAFHKGSSFSFYETLRQGKLVPPVWVDAYCLGGRSPKQHWISLLQQRLISRLCCTELFLFEEKRSFSTPLPVYVEEFAFTCPDPCPTLFCSALYPMWLLYAPVAFGF